MTQKNSPGSCSPSSRVQPAILAVVSCLLLPASQLDGQSWEMSPAPHNGARPPATLWPQFRRENSHTARTPILGPQAPLVKWRYLTGNKVYSSAAVGADGTLYFGSWDGHVYAFNPNGTLKWRFGTGNYEESSPAVGSDGTVYIGSYDAYLYALNANGSVK